MCCFSGEVAEVTSTRIFARAIPDGSQVLAYDMMLDARQDVAMVLPLPTPAGAADDAVGFIDLSGYGDLFDDLDRAFPTAHLPRGGSAMLSPRSQLVVHDVGDFEASFVPARADFSRLDPRFRLSDAALDALPVGADWGFAVFKLKHTEPVTGPAPTPPPAPGFFARLLHRPSEPAPPPPSHPRRFHPMAFRFPRRDPSRLFLPTVHVHDGAVHEVATFDHELYVQQSPPPASVEAPTWLAQEKTVSEVIDVPRTAGLLVADEAVWKATLRGRLPNRDTWLSPT